MLDVSAAFLTATGELEVDITGTSDIATISSDNGDLTITDVNGDNVAIDVDGNGPGGVLLEDIRSVVARGDAASDQQIIFAAELTPDDGVFVDDQIESVAVNAAITQVTSNGIDLGAGAISWGAELEAAGLDISFGGATTLTNNVTLTAANVIFEDTLDDDGDSATGSNVTVVALELTRFAGEVGGLNPLDGIETDAAGRTELNADITTIGNTLIFNDAVVLTSDVELTDWGSSGVQFRGTIDSEVDAYHSLTVTAPNGVIVFDGNIGHGSPGDQRLTALLLEAEQVVFGDTANVEFVVTDGAIDIDASIVFDAGPGSLLVSTQGVVALRGPVELWSDVVIDAGPYDEDIIFDANAPIDSQAGERNNLTLFTGTGNIRLGAPVGFTVPLATLQINSARDVTFDDSVRVESLRQLAGSGQTRLDGPVTILTAAGVELTTATVVINERLETVNDGPVLIDVSDDISVNAEIAAGSGLVQLLADDDVSFGASGSITADAAVLVQADADAIDDAGVGGAVVMADGAVIDAGTNTITILADEQIQLGRLITTSDVMLNSASGGIVDGGDQGGADIAADRLALQAATGIGTNNPLDVSIREVAARNEAQGGVRVANDTGGGTLVIGEVGGLIGISGGPLMSPADLGGQIEVVNAGAIEVAAAVLNFAGGHTTLQSLAEGTLTVNQPVQNRGGDGWMFLLSAGDLLIHHSLPEPDAEILVEHEGAIRGLAEGLVLIDNGPADYVIIRTHAERFPDPAVVPALSPKFSDPAFFPPPTDTAFYAELEAELKLIRESVSPQATNFAPLLLIEAVDQGGSNLDGNGRGILKVTLGDDVHLERNWHLIVDWGDGIIEDYPIPGNPEASRGFFRASGSIINRFPDATITPRFDSGVEGELGVYYLHHTYTGPPNPLDPSAPIPVRVELRYDPRESGDASLDSPFPESGSPVFNGIRFFQNGGEELFAAADTEMTNPGQGAFAFIKILESTIIPVEPRPATVTPLAATNTVVSVTTGQVYDVEIGFLEDEVFEDYRLFMRVVDSVSGLETSQEYELPLGLLDDPLSIFRDREFPNGQYRVYMEELRTGRVRLILEVFMYDGRVVPPNFREGVGERQPGVEQQDAGAASPAEQPAPPRQEAPDEPLTETSDPMAPPPNEEGAAESATRDARNGTATLPLAAASVWHRQRQAALRDEFAPRSLAALRLWNLGR